ncbi:AMP-binding protein [Paenibacillus sp. FJAT-26967]|uniref:AMP-binding protein n=1 Tax=Paenibacillus sp. FJAT-26967 TaxID=1729690 RepID=UPI00083821B9|nr:AMP-binding protein [Paenibacillus sp. FJAT-26967]
MLAVNRTQIDAAEFSNRLLTYERMAHFRRIEGRRIALCLSDPVDVVRLVLLVRGQGGSVLLIHGDTPLETALHQAGQAGCSGLVYQNPENWISAGQDRYAKPEDTLAAGLEHELPPAYGTSSGNEPSLLQFSSGTTGSAKLIRRTWQEIDIELAAYNEALETDESEVPIVLPSVTHSYGLLCGVLASLRRGASPVIVTNRNPKFALNLIRDTPKHLVYGVPPLLHILSSFPGESVPFHKIMSSGAPMPGSLYDKLRPVVPVMMQQYGCSEAGCISISNQMETNADMGKPLGHLQVAVSQDEAHPSELLVTTNSRKISTGDIGYLSEQGNLRVVSRMDDVINVSGLKVFPMEVEDVLSRCTGIRESVVYRGQHPVMGETVKAQIVAEPAVAAQEVMDWCMQWLPPYKVPSEIRIVSEIPKNTGGKISRRLLEMGDLS